MNQRIISATMEGYGHKIVMAENGARAVEELQAGDYDLILMDVRMPEMSGPDATRMIRQLPGEKSKIPIIALTADAAAEHKKEYYEAGMDEVVTKPIDRGELLEAINKVMDEKIHVAVEIKVKSKRTEEDLNTKNTNRENAPAEPSPNIDDFLKKLEAFSDGLDEEKT